MGVGDVEHLRVLHECHNIGVEPRNLLPPHPTFPPPPPLIFKSENPNRNSSIHIILSPFASGCFRDSLYLFPIYNLPAPYLRRQNGIFSLLLKLPFLPSLPCHPPSLFATTCPPLRYLFKYEIAANTVSNTLKHTFSYRAEVFVFLCLASFSHLPPTTSASFSSSRGRPIFYRLFLNPYLGAGRGRRVWPR